jgi:hypothetical protein
MPWGFAAAAVGGALVSGVGSNMAANTQANAQNNATQMQLGMYNTNNANLAPFRTAGAGATSTIQQGLAPGGSLNSNFTGADYLANQDPGYQFQLNQGTSALQNSQAANSGALSGSALKGLMSYNQDYASTGYQNAFNRWQSNQSNTYSRLMGLAGLGENAAAQAGNNATSFGQGIANTTVGAGNATAAGIVGSSNAASGALSSAPGYYYMNQMLNQNANQLPAGSQIQDFPAGTASGTGGSF